MEAIDKTSSFLKVKERPPTKKKNKKKTNGEKLNESLELASLNEFVADKIGGFMDDMIPEEVKALPEPYMTRVGYFCVLGFFATFLFFFSIQVKSGEESSYISLDYDPKYCTEVPKGVSNTFTATDNGKWKGQVGFQAAETSYYVDLNNFIGSMYNYSSMMKHFRSDLQYFSDVGMDQLVPYQVLLWTSFYSEYKINDNIHTIRLAGDPSTIFKTSNAYGSFANANGICSSAITKCSEGVCELTWSNNKTVYEASYKNDPIPQYILNGRNCTIFLDQNNNNTLLYQYDVSNLFSLSIDMDSYVTAAAFNMGILSYDALEIVLPSIFAYSYIDLMTGQNVALVMNVMYDPKYPGMTPIFCTDPASHPMGKAFCSVYFMTTYLAIPSFYSWLASESNDIQDTICPPCGSPPIYDKYGYNACNNFNFITSLNIFSMASYDLSEPGGLFDIIVNKWNFDMQGFQNASYNAAYIAALGNYLSDDIQYNSNDDEIQNNTKAVRSKAFEFCDNNCWTLSLASTPYYMYDMVLNEDLRTLSDAYCKSSIVEETFDDLVEHSPTSLVENYYKCRDSDQNIFLDAVGIANGNTAAFLPVFVSLLLPLVFLYLKCIGKPPPVKEYTSDEVQDALKYFAFQLLRAKDGKSRAFPKHGTIVKLVDELMAASKTSAGYPDSDDDDMQDDEKPEEDTKPTGSKQQQRPKKETIHEKDTKNIQIPTSKASSSRNSTNAVEMGTMLKETKNPMSTRVSASSSSPSSSATTATTTATTATTTTTTSRNSSKSSKKDSDDEEDA